jgi:5-methyltetrahydrofolate--homocysteine methyltransferase
MMGKKKEVQSLLKKRVLILDGATGTELQKRGMPSGVCPESWCIDHPDVISSIHRDYLEAGSHIVFTCTFGANRMKLAQYGMSNVGDVNRRLAEIARETAGTKGLVAGDIGPTGRFVAPFGDLAFEDAVEVFKEQVRGLRDGGVDLFVIETMMDIQEARAALIAVKELADEFTIVTMTCEEDGRTLNGTDPLTALITLQSLGADAVGCNCSTGPKEMIGFIEQMRTYATVPLVAKPNAGMPRLIDGRTVFTMEPGEFGTFGSEFARRGVAMIGGCCGTTPDHIRALSFAMTEVKSRRPERKAVSAVSSSRRTVLFDRKGPVIVIGERINPTGKKALHDDLISGRMDAVREMARQQEVKKADLLDVNVGMPGIDEVAVMDKVIGVLSTSSSLPLVIDSSDVQVIERALRIYPGRALVNSLTGEKEKLKKLLPVAARYGAMVIVLPITDKGVPPTAEERAEVIEDIVQKARKYRFKKEDIVVDGVVMALSADPAAPAETLKTVEWSARKLKCTAMLGLTNVSFGMPGRRWLDAAFMAMAIERGATAVIANPEVEVVMNVKAASDVLMSRDGDASAYCARFADTAPPERGKEAQGGGSPEGDIRQAIMDGNREGIGEKLAAALSAGADARRLVNEVMIPAITDVGDLYEKKAYFLPQLMASAETMKIGMARLEPCLHEKGTARKNRPTILIASVQGDIHDIGKNIVALMLGNQGFDVVDLGKDVATNRIIKEAKKRRPEIIALSALMTTTMVTMRDVVTAARRESLECPVIIGGAVVTESYAEEIGAHYARDGVEAVKVAERLVKKAT